MVHFIFGSFIKSPDKHLETLSTGALCLIEPFFPYQAPTTAQNQCDSYNYSRLYITACPILGLLG